MRVVRRRSREFYVGALKRRNSEELGLVVYAASDRIESSTENYVQLFELAENSCSEFRKDTVRKLIGSPAGFSDSSIEAAVDEYCRAAQIDPEAEWHEAQELELKLKRLHDNYLLSVGIPSQGCRRVPRRQRTTPCYCRRAFLDNTMHMECSGCRGIICYSCGGCLCGR